jgi:hypothetical protein
MMDDFNTFSRRTFMKQCGVLPLGWILPFSKLNASQMKDLVIGHGAYRYKVDMNWGVLDKTTFPVKDCHEMVYTKEGNIIMLTNETKNNIIIYNKDGKLLQTWGNTYPGGHGLTLKDEGGEEFLYITDTERHAVIKTDMNGREIIILHFPRASVHYNKPEAYLPTETAVADNGDIYVADGYGSQYIIHYDSQGILKNVFGGPGDGVDKFQNAHGIAIDSRDGQERLLITARTQNQLKYFSLGGAYESTVDLDGAFICRPVIHGDNVYLATIWSGDGSPNTGFISILNKENQLISAPGGNSPVYTDGKLQSMHQTLKVFSHPHDVCVDEDENLYVCQWNAGQTYPIKLIRI